MIFQINVFELGGGSQLYRANYIGEDIGETVVVPVNSAEIISIAVFVNGANVDSVTWEPYADSTAWDTANSYLKLDVVSNNSGTYYRALQDVPVGINITNVLYWFAFVPTLAKHSRLWHRLRCHRWHCHGDIWNQHCRCRHIL
jgi:hypothetical protein